MVENEIEAVCKKVILSHVEPLKDGENMNYIVKHGTK